MYSIQETEQAQKLVSLQLQQELKKSFGPYRILISEKDLPSSRNWKSVTVAVWKVGRGLLFVYVIGRLLLLQTDSSKIDSPEPSPTKLTMQIPSNSATNLASGTDDVVWK